MKRFLFKLLLFLAPLVACGIYMEVKLSQLPNTYSKKKTDFEKKMQDVNVLVLGTSHALHDINPQYFSYNGFNLANASQTLYYDKELVFRYIDSMPKLKVVMLTMNYYSFFAKLSETHEAFRCFFYSTYWNIDEPGLPRWDMKRYSKIALYTPETSLGFAFKGFKVDLTQNLNALGYLAYDTVNNLKNISYKEGAKRVELYRRMMKDEHLIENKTYLSDLVTTLRRRGVLVYIINTPVYKTFTRFCDPAVLEGNSATIKYICRIANCKYLDYSNDPRFDISDFYDNDHLNDRGATKFSLILDNEILKTVNFNR
ncbi:MAG: hypothetical protein JST82_10015 [Bacteroidetes bacterium]|nr:hypothetical protein [Bacteroidota bacterium]